MAVVVILLNILIAQMSSTYSEAKKTARLQYDVDRMLIITRLEHSRFQKFVSWVVFLWLPGNFKLKQYHSFFQFWVYQLSNWVNNWLFKFPCLLSVKIVFLRFISLVTYLFRAFNRSQFTTLAPVIYAFPCTKTVHMFSRAYHAFSRAYHAFSRAWQWLHVFAHPTSI